MLSAYMQTTFFPQNTMYSDIIRYSNTEGASGPPPPPLSIPLCISVKNFGRFDYIYPLHTTDLYSSRAQQASHCSQQKQSVSQ